MPNKWVLTVHPKQFFSNLYNFLFRCLHSVDKDTDFVELELLRKTSRSFISLFSPIFHLPFLLLVHKKAYLHKLLKLLF